MSKENFMTIRETLLNLSTICNGDYEKMISMIKNKERVKDDYMADTNCKFITLLDEVYPSVFKHINKPPILLYYYGNISLLEEKNKLTVVGSREPTDYQKEMTKKLVGEVIDKMNGNVTIVSGMAKGIDQIAMLEAVKRNTKLISIIGSGIDNPYPQDNNGIYEYCKSDKGLILSEYPLYYTAKKEDFLFRNRLLAAICKCLLVTGAKRRSGTSSTIRYAIEDGKDILALPCNISIENDDLTNSLIQEGAKVVLTSDDIIDSLSSSF